MDTKPSFYQTVVAICDEYRDAGVSIVDLIGTLEVLQAQLWEEHCLERRKKGQTTGVVRMPVPGKLLNKDLRAREFATGTSETCCEASSSPATCTEPPDDHGSKCSRPSI